MKRLIVNADDFGMTSGVNRAVLQAHQSGIVTSTTLMATGAAAEEAIVLAKENPAIDVGCHVVLLEGNPLLEAANISSLATIDKEGRSRFRRSFAGFVTAALTEGINGSDVYREAKAQILRLRDAGLDVLHVDTHKHAHVFPAIFKPLLRAAVDCGVRAVRNPFEPAGVMSWNELWRRRELWARYLPVRALQTFADDFRRECDRLGIATPEGTLGITLTGFADQASFSEVLNRVPEGTWELLCHPSYEDEQWLTLGPRPGSGLQELRVLLSAQTKAAVTDNQISLVSFADVYANVRPMAHPATAATAVAALGDAAA